MRHLTATSEEQFSLHINLTLNKSCLYLSPHPKHALPLLGSFIVFTHICSTVSSHFPHLPTQSVVLTQYQKRSRIREQVCSSFSALPVSSQRKVVVPYSLVSHPHCPLLDSPSTSHTCPLCYPLPHSLICVVPSGSTCQGTIQHSLPNKVCVKYYLLLQQFLLFVFPPTPSHSFPLLLSPPHSLSLPLAPSHSLSL